MRSLLTAAALIALSALLIACSDDGDASPPTPTSDPATPAPTAIASPQPPSDAIELTVGDTTPFPEDIAIIIATGCTQCDGPTTSIVRLRRTADGIEQRTLFDDVPQGGSITGFAFDVTTGRAAVTTCAPNCTGLGEITGTEQTIVHLSTDGGATFTASPPFDGWFSVSGYTNGELVITGPFDGDDDPNPFRTYPALEALASPPGAEYIVPLPPGPLWLMRERSTLLSPEGDVLFTSAGDNVSEVASLTDAGDRLAALIYRAEGQSATYRLLILRRTAGDLQHERTLTGGYIHVGAALDDCTVLANADLPAGTFPTPDTEGFFVGILPSVVDVCEGVIHPILDPFTQPPYLNGRNHITAVQRGPFRSVPDDIGDCLNVRESPATDAPSLGCFAAGVLLRDLQVSLDASGSWRNVETPSGVEGWASSEFLAP